ncbi:SufE family protein [Pollutimonas bauzanensis]|uniref:Cysteine desulfuration protein SufE n=1 Tax=Pollutimonas bauzanensis TaxID=658167 RepID=A0A1M5LTW4_9BURK|nr:SufE family protein [Pollutimonas bauzanensis]SHG68507.1 cysteine desulfuration protein SufE [Pollutimonas bauzanensis]
MVASPQPQPDIDQETIQTELVQAFACMPDWPERYQYLIDLGRTLQGFAQEYRIDRYKLHGCQASAWLKPECRDGRIYFTGTSDSLIAAGLMALLFRLYSGRTFSDVLTTSPWCLKAMGLHHHLSPQRATGLAGMVERMREFAVQYSRQPSINNMNTSDRLGHAAN